MCVKICPNFNAIKMQKYIKLQFLYWSMSVNHASHTDQVLIVYNTEIYSEMNRDEWSQESGQTFRLKS